MDLAAVAVGVVHEQEPGFDLAEPVDDPVDAEIGGGGREHSADRSCCQHHRDGLDDVRQPRCDAVAGADPRPTHRNLELPDEQPEFLAADLPVERRVLCERDHRRLIARNGTQQILSDVERGIGKEPGPPERFGSLDDPVAPVPDHTQLIPHRSPEIRWLSDGPGVHLLVCREPVTATELSQIAAFYPARRRHPQQRSGGVHRGTIPRCACAGRSRSRGLLSESLVGRLETF